MSAVEASIEGRFIAKEGSIGGFHITENHLASTDSNDSTSLEEDPHLVMISGTGWKTGATATNPGKYAFWAGAKTSSGDDSTRPFWIRVRPSASAWWKP
mgnify:CR=1 FL=1